MSINVESKEVHFTPEQQARLAQIAIEAGTQPELLVTNVVARNLDEESHFLAAVEKGIAEAGETSSRKRKWTAASKRCSGLNANSWDASGG